MLFLYRMVTWEYETKVHRCYPSTRDRTVSMATNMTRSPIGERMKPWR
jgi:hypothetical protein